MSPNLHGARVFITGGAGFIGSHIADQLLASGAEHVMILDDFVRGRLENLESAMQSGRVDVVRGDICDPTLVDSLTAGADFVFHQAALRITQCAEDPVRAIDVMVGGTQNVLESAVKHRVGRVLSASSASVYGEPSYLPMDEGHPFNNRTLYGAAKIASEQMHRAYAEMYGISYVMLRPFNVYGPRMDVTGVYTEVMVRWLERLLNGGRPVIFGNGEQTMDFVSVEDVAAAYLLAATSTVDDVVLNAGTGVETSLLKLCELMCEAVGAAVEPEFAPARQVNSVSRRCAAIENAGEQIGFRASTGIATGINSLVEWYRHDPAAVANRP